MGMGCIKIKEIMEKTENKDALMTVTNIEEKIFPRKEKP